MSGQVSRGSAGEDQADDARLLLAVSGGASQTPRVSTHRETA